jgi:hypothetical protein
MLVHVSIPTATAAPIHNMLVSFPGPLRSRFHMARNENNLMR